NLSVSINGIECRCDDSERCAQLVSGVRRELSLKIKSLLEPVQRVINRGDQRRDFARQVLLGQSNRHGAGSDRRCHPRDACYRPEGTSNCQRANDQSGDNQQRNDPPQIQYKFAQQGVNQYVSISSACDRYGQRASRTALHYSQTVVLAPLAAKVLQMEIAWVVRSRRPFSCNFTEVRRRG